MILTRTPLRISLVGGGTDMAAFYRHSFGAVISFAIDKYIYVGVNHKFDGKVRVSYSRTENAGHAMELKHDIIRESLLAYGVHSAEVVTVADIPGEGTGLGSSSALAVGMSKALHQFSEGRADRPAQAYAEHGYHIEREMCQKPVGKQDHYAAAFGGMNYFQFESDESVLVEPIRLDPDRLNELSDRFALLWTGKTRSSIDILRHQELEIKSNKFESAKEMRDLAVALRKELRSGDFSNVGYYLQENWKLKKGLVHWISNSWIEEIYEKAIFSGAHGGKLCGAGGGGFLLFFGVPELGARLEADTGLRNIPFKIEPEGCRVIC